MPAGAEIAVIGAGVVGLSTAVHLLDLGLSVRVYERATPGGEQSAGAARIFQHAHDDPRLVAMAASSRRIYNRWQERFGAELLEPCGVLILGGAARAQAEALQTVGGLAHSFVSAPGEHLPLLEAARGPALLDESAGMISARSVIDSLEACMGGRLVTDDVLALRAVDDGIEVVCQAQVSRHSRAVICAGRGTAALARGLGVELPVEYGVQVRTTFPLAAPGGQILPCFQDLGGVLGEPGAYGLPLPGGDRYALGLTETADVRPDGSLTNPGQIKAFGERLCALAERLPGLVPEPVEQRACWTTALPWSDSGIAVWEAGDVLIPVGHHLFKHAPALGEALAAAAAGESLPADLAPTAHLGLAPG